MLKRVTTVGLLALCAVSACAKGANDEPDGSGGGMADAATPDGPEVGRPDADLSMPDAGIADAGAPDAKPADASPPDAMVPVPDAMPGAPDAGTPDACVPQWTDILINGGFESGPGVGWSESSAGGYPIVGDPPAMVTPQAGTKLAWLAGYDSANDQLFQNITVPAGTMALHLKGYYVIGTEETGTTPFDIMTFRIRDQAGTVLDTLGSFSNVNATAAWTPFDFTAPTPHAGQAIQIHVQATTDVVFNTGFLIDTMTLEVLKCP